MHSVYSWVVFLHVLGVFGFLFAHGTAAAVTFRLRPERNVDRIRMLLDLSGSVAVVGRVSLLALLAAGIALGFMGSWWGHGWIWTALGLFIVMSVSMTPLAAGSFNRLRRVTQSEGAPKGDAPQAGIAQAKAIEAAAAGLHPVALTVVGFGGLTLILWLMMFKPF